MFDAFKVGEKWTTVIPSTIDVDFFDSALSKFNTFLCDTIVPICLFCVTLIAADKCLFLAQQALIYINCT